MMGEMTWSKTEKSISRAAFDKALKNELDSTIQTVKEMARSISEPRQIWELEDYLRKKRREIDDKYDYRYSVLLFVFGHLVKEGWIGMEDLQGLAEEKIERIRLIAEAVY